MKQKQYDEIAKQYDSLFTDNYSIQENNEVAKRLNLTYPVIDIGCGTGLLLDLVDISPEKYIGVDPSINMIKELKKKHPSYTTINARFEDVDIEKINYNSLVALFGSASYIEKDSFKRIPDDKKMFLMFYKEDYHPVTYERTGKELTHFVYDKSNLKDMFPKCEIKEFNNYYIVSGL